MGWPQIAVYDGGWFEWSKDPLSNPIEVGEAASELAA
jgi:thiosulfate/3-mercaptopyruvate sulfurtransferase